MSVRIHILDMGQPDFIVLGGIVSALDESQHARSVSWLTPAEKARYESETVGRAQTFLAGRWLVRTLVSQLLQCDPAQLNVSAPCIDCGGEHGALRVSLGHASVRVSLSHSGNVHVVAASLNVAVGIDIELPREGVDVSQWSAREAEAKLHGWGLRVGRELGVTPVSAQLGSEKPEVSMSRFTFAERVGSLAWVAV